MQQKNFCPWTALCGYSFSSPGNTPPCLNDIKSREQTALIQSLFDVADQVEMLLEQAVLILNRKNHNADFINDIPKLMSDLYLNYLRMAAIFHMLDTDAQITLKSPFIVQARAIQADAGKALECLDSLFDPHADYGEEDDDGDEDEETAGKISTEADEDDLCRITIAFSDAVDETIADIICEQTDHTVRQTLRRFYGKPETEEKKIAEIDRLADYVCGLDDAELAIMRDAIEREARLREEEAAQHP